MGSSNVVFVCPDLDWNAIGRLVGDPTRRVTRSCDAYRSSLSITLLTASCLLSLLCLLSAYGCLLTAHSLSHRCVFDTVIPLIGHCGSSALFTALLQVYSTGFMFGALPVEAVVEVRIQCPVTVRFTTLLLLMRRRWRRRKTGTGVMIKDDWLT
jgi:hypothetical protein